MRDVREQSLIAFPCTVQFKIVLAVPDDVIPGLAGQLRMYSGQAMVHTSGALGAEALQPARLVPSKSGT